MSKTISDFMNELNSAILYLSRIFDKASSSEVVKTLQDLTSFFGFRMIIPIAVFLDSANTACDAKKLIFRFQKKYPNSMQTLFNVKKQIWLKITLPRAPDFRFQFIHKRGKIKRLKFFSVLY